MYFQWEGLPDDGLRGMLRRRQGRVLAYFGARRRSFAFGLTRHLVPWVSGDGPSMARWLKDGPR